MAMVAVLMLTAPAALAVDTDEEFDITADPYVNGIEDLGAGTCTPEEVAIEQVITCRFELVGNAAMIDDFSVLHGSLVGIDQSVGGRCQVEGRELVCPDIPVPYDEGEFGITVSPLGYDTTLATASVDRTTDGVLGLALASRRVPTFPAGVEISIETFRSFALADDEEAELVLRRAGDDTIVDRVPALAADAGDGMAVLTIPEPGRWSVTGCVAAPDGSCRIEGIRRPIHAIDPTPIPLIEGHNGPAEDRINLLFVGSGFQPDEDMVGIATSLLALDGEPRAVDATGDGDIFALDWGPFAVEPLVGQADRFNFWYLSDDVPGGPISINPMALYPSQVDIEDFGLGTAVSLINLSRNSLADGYRATAELVSFADDETLPDDRADISFGSVYLPYDGLTVSTATTLTHELGHSLFGLRDEYEEFGNIEPSFGPPNCAATIEEAETLWGDQVGELDPMFDRWREAMTDADLWFEEGDVADDFTVDLVVGGCFGDQENTDAVRPTRRGLMNGEEPVFGSVNRARVEAVIDLFPALPPPPPTTTSTAPAPTTTEADTNPTTEPELASDSVDDDTSGRPLLLFVGGLGAMLVAVGTAMYVRGRPDPED
ncbi:MAG: hypothetical protein AAFO29_00435 [Actinomycetota bacterium]